MVARGRVRRPLEARCAAVEVARDELRAMRLTGFHLRMQPSEHRPDPVINEGRTTTKPYRKPEPDDPSSQTTGYPVTCEKCENAGWLQLCTKSFTDICPVWRQSSVSEKGSVRRQKITAGGKCKQSEAWWVLSSRSSLIQQDRGFGRCSTIEYFHFRHHASVRDPLRFLSATCCR